MIRLRMLRSLILSSIIPVSRPHLGMLALEPVRALLELARAHLTDYENQPEGDGHGVVLFPGLGADHSFMSTLANHCERLGYVCYDWGRGRNTGPTGPSVEWLTDLAKEIAKKVDHHPEGVSLIGWSLGGLYAREVARALPRPSRVRQVITLGAPFANLCDSTNAGWLYEVLSGNSATVSKSLTEMLKRPLPVPTTSIYSRSDGVVAWEACVGVPGPLAENIEVDSSHIGLVWHPDVLKIIADRLGQRKGQWTAWRDTRRVDTGAESSSPLAA